jgi:hypothetical protein
MSELNFEKLVPNYSKNLIKFPILLLNIIEKDG